MLTLNYMEKIHFAQTPHIYYDFVCSLFFTQTILNVHTNNNIIFLYIELMQLKYSFKENTY